ncbi:hypothetical protein [Neisseria meningitidis]|uniref:hypothetical protein n=1 Tax=Neisseria meningitidis TaxID=487 RepID=UPI001863B039|nr:hypothetical protein [Neisseria meningitidis]
MLVLYGNFIDFDVFGKKSEEEEEAEKLTIFVSPQGNPHRHSRVGGNPDLRAAAIFKDYLKV